MRRVQVHPVSLNCARDTADKHHCAVRLHLFDHTDVGEWIVELPVSVEVPGIVKEYQVAGVGHRSLMKRAVPLDVGIDEFDSVGFWIMWRIAIEVNPVLQEDRACDASAVIGNLFALAGDGSSADELCCGKRDR